MEPIKGTAAKALIDHEDALQRLVQSLAGAALSGANESGAAPAVALPFEATSTVAAPAVTATVPLTDTAVRPPAQLDLAAAWAQAAAAPAVQPAVAAVPWHGWPSAAAPLLQLHQPSVATPLVPSPAQPHAGLVPLPLELQAAAAARTRAQAMPPAAAAEPATGTDDHPPSSSFEAFWATARRQLAAGVDDSPAARAASEAALAHSLRALAVVGELPPRQQQADGAAAGAAAAAGGAATGAVTAAAPAAPAPIRDNVDAVVTVTDETAGDDDSDDTAYLRAGGADHTAAATGAAIVLGPPTGNAFLNRHPRAGGSGSGALAQPSVAELLTEGARLFGDGRLDAARQAVEAALHVDADAAGAWRLLAQIHAEADDDASAVACLQRAIRCDPYDLESLLLLGVGFVNEGDTRRALSTLQAWVRHHPALHDVDAGADADGDASLVYAADDDRSLQGRVESLVEAARRVLPDDVDVLTLSGVMYAATAADAAAAASVAAAAASAGSHCNAAIEAFQRAVDVQIAAGGSADHLLLNRVRGRSQLAPLTASRPLRLFVLACCPCLCSSPRLARWPANQRLRWTRTTPRCVPSRHLPARGATRGSRSSSCTATRKRQHVSAGTDVQLQWLHCRHCRVASHLCSVAPLVCRLREGGGHRATDSSRVDADSRVPGAGWPC